MSSRFDEAVAEVMDFMPDPGTTGAEREARAIVERVLVAVEHQRLREAAQAVAITTCREWVTTKNDRCNAPAEFVLWGKLIAADGHGPRCYDHAAVHVGHRALGDPAWAIIDLRPLRAALAPADGYDKDAASDNSPQTTHNEEEETR